jgi:transcriptional regulator with XRE-family HTH domain/mannose-6-phosphate isomerase-like protein (cupin superfamily)
MGVVPLGARLRHERQKAGISLRELARRLGVSPSFVSQLENDKSSPSVATLYSIAQVLGTSIDSLFGHAAVAAVEAGAPALAQASAGGSPDPPAVVSRSDLGSPADGFPAGRTRSRLAVTRPGDRPRLVMDSGVVWEQLVHNTGRDLDFIEIVYPPHASSTTDRRMLQHAGFEYGYVLAGELEVTVGFETVRLAAGDSIGFDSAVPHLIRNVTADEARGLWVVRHVTA